MNQLYDDDEIPYSDQSPNFESLQSHRQQLIEENDILDGHQDDYDNGLDSSRLKENSENQELLFPSIAQENYDLSLDIFKGQSIKSNNNLISVLDYDPESIRLKNNTFKTTNLLEQSQIEQSQLIKLDLFHDIEEEDKDQQLIQSNDRSENKNIVSNIKSEMSQSEPQISNERIVIKVAKDWDNNLEELSRNVPYLEKMTAKFDLNNKLIFPYDRYDYIQSMFNPVAENGSDEILTVQICKPYLKPIPFCLEDLKQKSDSNPSDQRNYKIECPENQSGNCELLEKINNSEIKCFYCLSIQLKGKQCKTPTHNYFVCDLCQLQHYVRKKVVEKTSDSSYYENYVIQAFQNEVDFEDDILNNIDSQSSPESFKKNGLFKQMQSLIQRKIQKAQFQQFEQETSQRHKNLQSISELTKNVEEGTINAKNFASIHKVESNQQSNCRFAIVGLWKKINEVYECYRLIKIERPLIMKGNSDSQPVVQLFLHVSQNKEIYFFTKGQQNNDEIIFNILDLKQEQFNDQNVLQNAEDLKVKQQNKIESQELVGLFKHVFGQKGQEAERCMSPPHLILHSGKYILVILSTFQEEKGVLINEKKSKAKPNLYFIEIALNQVSLQLVIKDARLFLQIQTRKNQEFVWFIRDNKLMMLNWKYTLQNTQSEYCSRQYFLSPSRNPNICQKFDQETYELNQLLRQQQSKNLMFGRVHNNGKRISLLFQNGNVFTFIINFVDQFSLLDTIEWFGQKIQVDLRSDSQKIDEITTANTLSGFSNSNSVLIERLSFQIEPYHPYNLSGKWFNGRRELAVEGQLILSNSSWSGYIYQTSKSQYIKIDNLQINDFKNIPFFDSRKSSKGSPDLNRSLNIKFKQDLNGQTIQYEGEINKSLTQIQGVCKKNNHEYGTFFIQMENLRHEIILNLQNGKQMTGVVDLKEYTIDLNETNINDFKYQFIAKHRPSAENCFQLSGQKNFQNGQFSEVIFSDQQRKLFAISFKRNKIQNQNVNGYEKIDLVAIDLDQAAEGDKKEFKNYLHFSCVMPKAFKLSKNQNSSYKLPPHFLMQVIVETESNQCTSLKGQMFFSDPATDQTSLVFIKGTARKLDIQQQNIVEEGYIPQYLPQWPSLFSDDIYIQYPLIAYKSSLPTNNEIIIINTIYNQPQQIININPFKFVKFIETGMNPTQYFERRNQNSSILFLVQDLDGNLRVMYYKAYPFQKYLQNGQLQNRNYISPSLMILPGHLSKKEISNDENISKNWNQRTTREKIVCATLLKQPTDDEKCPFVAIVLQLVGTIVYFNLSEQKKKLHYLKFKDSQMAQIKIQRSPLDEIYFVERHNLSGHQDHLIRLSLKEFELKKSVIKKTVDSRIVGIQIIPPDGLKSLDHLEDHSLMYFDSEFKFSIIQITDSKNQNTNNKTEIEISLQEHPDYEEVLQYLKINPWPQIIGNSRGFTVLKNQHTTTFSTFSEMCEKNYKLFNFIGDQRFKERRLNRDSENQQFKSHRITSLKQVPQIQKHFYVVQGNGKAELNYFMITNSKFTRSIDLMRPDQRQQIQNESYWDQTFLIGSSLIAIKNKNDGQYMFFNQADQMFQINNELGFDWIWPMSKTENEKQFYFSRLKKKHQQTSKEQILELQEKQEEVVFRQTNIVWSNVVKNIEILLKEKIDFEFPKDREAINFIHCNVIFDESKIIFLAILPQVDNFKTDKSQNTTLGENLIKIQQNKKGRDPEIANDISKFYLCRINFGEVQFDCFVIQQVDQPKSYDEGSKKLIFTPDYCIFSIENKLFQIKKEILYKTKKVIDSNTQKSTSFSDIFDIVSFKVTNFSEFFPDYLKNTGLKMKDVSKYNLDIAEKHIKRKNVIQITFELVSILYDLDEDKEVSFVEFTSQFVNYNNFVPTGVLPSVNSDWTQDCNYMNFVQTNEKGTLFLQPQNKTKSHQSIVFRTYCELDLLDMKFLKNQTEQNLSVNRINYETALAILDGKTFFEEFQNELSFFEMIFEQIKSQNIQQKFFKDEHGTITDNILIRRLYRTLLMPTQQLNKLDNVSDKNSIQKWLFSQVYRRPSKYQLDNKNKIFLGIKNILQAKLSDQQGQHILNCLLKILMISEEFKLGNVVTNMVEFKQLIQSKSLVLSQFMDNCSFSNDQTQLVKPLKWDWSHQYITFGSNTSQLNPRIIADQVEIEQKYQANFLMKFANFFYIKIMKIFNCGAKIKDQDLFLLPKNMQTTPVKVTIFDIEWLSRYMEELFTIMNDQNDYQLFGKKLIIVLLGQQNYNDQIVLKYMIIYFFYCSCNLVYMSVTIPQGQLRSFMDSEAQYGDGQGAWLRILIIVLSILFILKDVFEIYWLRLSYLKCYWQIAILSSVVINLSVTLLHSTDYDALSPTQLIQFSSLALIWQWFVLFSWMRMFSNVSFYVTMIFAVFDDIKYFLVLFLICLLIIGNSYYMINLSRYNQYLGLPKNNTQPYVPLYNPTFNNSFVDSIVTQYKIGIQTGDAFVGDPEQDPLLQCYYLFATFFTQIMFLNMLIGIMSATFTRVTEERHQNALIEKTKIYVDYIRGINFTKKMLNKRYLYVIEPHLEEEDSNFDESMRDVKRNVTKNQIKIQNAMVKQLQSVHEQIGEISRSINEKIDKKDIYEIIDILTKRKDKTQI